LRRLAAATLFAVAGARGYDHASKGWFARPWR
jgi:hypothetical protein